MRGWVALAAAVLVTGCQPVDGANAPAQPSVDEASAPSTALVPGMCLNDVDQPLAAQLTEIPTVDCAEPHQSEVYADITLEGEDYPGVDQVNDFAAEACEEAFGEFIGVDYRVSELSFHYYYPTFSRFAEGDRSIYCVAFDPEGDTTGSLEGVAR